MRRRCAPPVASIEAWLRATIDLGLRLVSDPRSGGHDLHSGESQLRRGEVDKEVLDELSGQGGWCRRLLEA